MVVWGLFVVYATQTPLSHLEAIAPNFAWGTPLANTPCLSCSHKENSITSSRREACDLGSSNQLHPHPGRRGSFRGGHMTQAWPGEVQGDSRRGSTVLLLCIGCEAQRKARWGSSLHLLTPRESLVGTKQPTQESTAQLVWERNKLSRCPSFRITQGNQPFSCAFQLF